MDEHASTTEAQRAALLDRVYRADTTRDIRSRHVVGLNNAMAVLQQQTQTAHVDMMAATRIAFDAINACSKFESRLLADAITDHLPRELRDMIYRMCWDEKLEKYDHYDNERPWRATEVTEEELLGQDDDCSEYRIPPHPRAKALGPYLTEHFVNPMYVGGSAAREAAEAFYRAAPAYLETLEAEVLEDYFEFDNFCLDVNPSNFVTSITVFLDMCSRQSKTQWGHYNGKLPSLHLTKEALATILGPNPCKLPLFTFLVKEETPKIAIQTFELSRKLYDQLKELGANVQVVYRYGSGYGGQKVGPVNLHGIMELPRGEWESHFKSECQKQDPKSSMWVTKHIEAIRSHRYRR